MTTTINLTDALTTEDKTTVEDLALGVCVAKHFGEDNSTVLNKLEDLQPVTISCVGDSVTWGSDTANSGTQVGTPYPERLQEILRLYFGNTQATVLNKGVQGSDTTDTIFQLPNIVADSPNLVIMCTGVNDARGDRTITVDDYKDNLSIIVEELIDNDIKVVMFGITEVQLRNTASTNGAVIESYRAVQKEICLKYGLVYLGIEDLMTVALKKNANALGQLSEDRLHWSQEGYNLIAESIFAEYFSGTNIYAWDETIFTATLDNFVPTAGTTDITVASTEDTIAVRVNASSELSVFIYCRDVNMQSILYVKEKSANPTLFDIGAFIQNKSLNIPEEYMNTSTLIDGIGSVSYGVAVAGVKLRYGLNIISIRCDTSTFEITSIGVIKEENNFGLMASSNQDLAENKFDTYLDDTTWIKQIYGKSIVQGTSKVKQVGVLLPRPFPYSSAFRIRCSMGQYGFIALGEQKQNTIGVYAPLILINFRATQLLVYIKNIVGNTSAVLTSAISTAASTEYCIDIYSDIAGSRIYVDGTIVATLTIPLPVGTVSVDTGTGGNTTIIDSISQMSYLTSPGVDIPGEMITDYNTGITTVVTI